MTRITRAVPVQALAQLLQSPPRATLAFVRDGRVDAIPVAWRWVDSRFFVGLPPEIEVPRGRVKVLVDDGPWYFDLRGVWVRGTLEPAAGLAASPAWLWFEVRAEKTAAWHYGRMRDVP